MNGSTRFVGFDVSKARIEVAIADEGRERARNWGAIANEAEKVRHLLDNLGPREQLLVCYEAGPTGYGLWRQLKRLGVPCIVVAPSLIATPRRSSEDRSA